MSRSMARAVFQPPRGIGVAWQIHAGALADVAHDTGSAASVIVRRCGTLIVVEVRGLDDGDTRVGRRDQPAGSGSKQ